LHFDITGLPPQPDEIEAFARDYGGRRDEALSEWIDRLMARTAWGEHQARYWLDAARYGDTHGMHFDNYREMWPYRDWVIRAFNNNQPFDQFVVEQLSGDMLPNPTNDQLTATGFQRCNITTNEGGTIEEENLALYAADRVQTFGWVFLGLTTNCCQCHDHKFDPLSTKDYYSLAAYFRNTTQTGLDGNNKEGNSAVLVIPSAEDRTRWEELPDEIVRAKSLRDSRLQSSEQEFEKWLAGLESESASEQVDDTELIVYVALNEGVGTEVQSSGAAKARPRATGELNWLPDGILGPSPKMLRDKTIDLGSAGDWEWNQPFSYGAWVKAPNDSSSGGILARMDERANFRGWDLWQNGSAYAVHLIDSWPGNALKVVSPNNSVRPGIWQHLFVTCDGSGKPEGIKIFINGQSQKLVTETNTLKPNASIRTTTPTRIGQRSDQQLFDGGQVQDVRLYNRTLAAGEIRSLVRQGVLTGAKSERLDSPESNKNEHRAAAMQYYLNNIDVEFAELETRTRDLETELAAIRARSPVTHIQKEIPDSMPEAHILLRGEYDKKGERVTAGTPAILHAFPKNVPNNRLGLAQWVVDATNPLTARVTVNRFWQQVFGQGLVATSEDFGAMGTPPVHPELLDWLAVEFQEIGWDVKALHKLIFMSAAYRQSAAVTPEKLERDRSNALLSRGPRFRMDAEMIRDLVLSASGLLSPKMYGPPAKPYQPEHIWDVVGLPEGDTRTYVVDKGENLYRRSLYTFWKRMAHPPNMDIFNAPSREVCTVRRERTNTPLQALVIMNDPLFVEAARNLAMNVTEQTGVSAAKIVDRIGLRVLGRELSAIERDSVLADYQAFVEYYRSNPQAAAALIDVGDSSVNGSLEPTELASWTMICNQFLCLDEAICK
jgi:hypothetical protein